MADSLFSDSWYRVAHLKPRLRAHVDINRHVYRGEVWYVIQDDATGRYHRFNRHAYAIIGLMNGRRTLDDIWHSAGEKLGEDMPSQDDVLDLLAQLNRADITQTNTIPDIGELSERRRKDIRNKWLAMIKSPLAVKFPLYDPEDFLERTAIVGRYLYNWLSAFIWLAAIAWALTQAAYHWPELTGNLADRVLATENLLLLWLVYPCVKLVHEFGHAYAVKRWGGEVHEMGLMFLIFMPIPYVNASASATFRNKYQRMLVSAAGIMSEAFIAAIGMWVWVQAEPGVVRSIAFNTMLIAGVSTVFFNGNPLLRFDAYYVLADWLEIPNLAARGNRQVAYLCKYYLLGLTDEVRPAYSRREARWMVGYALTSFAYRVLITFTIVFFIVQQLFFIGVLLAAWSIYNMFVKPLLGMARFLLMDSKLHGRRPRAIGVAVSVVGLVTALLFAVPAPHFTVAQGVFWASEEAQVHAETRGFLRQVHVRSGSRVRRGQRLFTLYNHELDSNIQEAEGLLEEVRARYQIALAEQRNSEAAVLLDEIGHARLRLEKLRGERDNLTIYSPRDAVFSLALPPGSENTLVHRGKLLGYLLEPGDYLVRVAVDQADAEAIRSDLQQVTVRLAERVYRELDAQLVRAAPGAQKNLPSPALSVNGGGEFILDPAAKDGSESFVSLFTFDVSVPDLPIQRIGERVYARFRHTPEPIGFRVYRALRRLVLSKLEF